MSGDTMKTEQNAEILRRPIQARNTKWAAAVTRWLVRAGLRPNHISVLSMFFGALAGAFLLLGGRGETVPLRVSLLLAAAGCMQMRLLCNLFDGMVAIEGGFKTRSGEVFNELPDRVSDILIFLAAGYSHPELAWMRELGWAAALLAVLTAYVRAFGGAAGVSQPFCGPMAKQQRMAVMTFACVLGAIFAGASWGAEITRAALLIVALGCNLTIARRVLRIIGELEAR
jgi:phosphatidylglycerophosphate synthase